MKLKKLIKDLIEYQKEYPDAKVEFNLIPNDGSEDEGDENDIPLSYKGCLSTSNLEDLNILTLGVRIPKKFKI